MSVPPLSDIDFKNKMAGRPLNNLNLKSTFGNRISRLLLISKHNSSQKISSSENSRNDLSGEEKTRRRNRTRNIFDKRLSVDEIDELSIEDIEKGVTQELIKTFHFRRFKIYQDRVRNDSLKFPCRWRYIL